MIVLLDTNLLTRLVNPIPPVDHQIAKDAIDCLLRAGHDPCIVPQVIYEFWVVATRPRNLNGLGKTPSQTRNEVDSILGLIHLLKDERAIFVRWLQLVSDHDVRGKPAHDARLVAAMLRHSITHLLTFNVADFKRYTNITAVEPSELVSGKLALP